MVDIRNPQGNTLLNQIDELGFRNWNDFWANTNSRRDLSHNPDATGQLYDYRGQYKAGVPMLPDHSDGYMLHGDSRFKKAGHARSIVEEGDHFLNTKSGQRGTFSELVPPMNDSDEVIKSNGAWYNISPIGFGNAPRGMDPMGQTSTITNKYAPSPQTQALSRVIDAIRRYNLR
jgi:hypothetical protein